MKILVAVKRVVDYNVRVRVKADKSGVETQNVKMSMNPFDENAIEEAIKLKESSLASEVIAVSIGPEKSQETIRTALAMGADRGIHVAAAEGTEPLVIAKILKQLVEKEQPSLVLTGKQAIDDDSNQTAQMLAALLGWSQATFVSALSVSGDTISATREVDGGLEKIALSTPAVVSVDLRLNTPRYASLPNIMKAKKKPLESLSASDLGIDTSQRLQTLEVSEPPARAAGVRVGSVAELVEKLQSEADVL